MKRLILATPLFLNACMPTISAEDFWVEVHPDTAADAVAASQSVLEAPLTVTQTFAFGRQGTLVCGTSAGEDVALYVDEAGRVSTEEVPESPCG